jgi:hypothetical protein
MIIQELSPSVFSPWESYYVIVGSSGAALTGLQFVVMALAAETRRTDGGAIDAYATPTVVHFCVALYVAAVLSSPWHGLGGPAIALGICGLFGVCYALIATRRALRQTGYKPVFEDWLFHTILPLLAYAVLLVSSIFVRTSATALFPIAGAVLLLLFIGIHNAWDTVTYLTLDEVGRSEARPEPAAAPPPSQPARSAEPVG